MGRGMGYTTTKKTMGLVAICGVMCIGSLAGLSCGEKGGKDGPVKFCGETWSLRTTEIACWKDSVRNLTPLSKLTKLKTLSMGGTKVTNLTPLSKLTKLKTLSLRDTKVTNLTPLSKLTKLKWLDLSNTKVTNLTPLSKLTKLKRLYLLGTNVSKSQVAALKKALPNLRIER